MRRFQRISRVVYGFGRPGTAMVFDQDGQQVQELQHGGEDRYEGHSAELLQRLRDYWSDDDTEFIDASSMNPHEFARRFGGL